jgi:hypothetical protein
MMDVSSISINDNPEFTNTQKQYALLINNVYDNITISYTMPMENVAELNIYTITGNVAIPVVNGMQASGMHSVTIKKNTLPAGVYVVGLKTGTYQENKTVLLIK